MSPVCRSSTRPRTRRTTMSQHPSGVVTPRQALSKPTRVTRSTSGESDARTSRRTPMRASIRPRASGGQYASARPADLAEGFANVLDPVLRDGHRGVVTAVWVVGPADDGVAGFPVPADGDVPVLEDGDRGRHAGVGFGRPRARIVGVFVVEADAR